MKILKGLVPNFSDPSYKLKTYCSQIRGMLCLIPGIQTGASERLRSLKDMTFAVRGPRLFNCLPKNLRDTNLTLDAFKALLDKWLEGIPDEPRLENYPSVSATNSIIDQCYRMPLFFIILTNLCRPT